MAHVLVTGGGGYIGTVLCKELLRQGHSVRLIDRFYFGEEMLHQVNGLPGMTVVKKDIRDIDEIDMAGIDAVCDLAALSNDPSAEIDPDLTWQINHLGRVKVARTAKRAGVPRYVLSSSCSVYGMGLSQALTEEGETAPLTIYAKAALRAEEDTLAMNDTSFSVTVLRNSTVFGLSPRMRFDLVVNRMTLDAVKHGRINVAGRGVQWRPFVHVKDVARAFQRSIEAPMSAVHGQIFNVGLCNFQVISIAYLVREALPFPLEIFMAANGTDMRSYNVSFEKATERLGFTATTSLVDGIREVYEGLKFGHVDDTPETSTVNWYRGILQAKKLIDSIALNGRVI